MRIWLTLMAIVAILSSCDQKKKTNDEQSKQEKQLLELKGEFPGIENAKMVVSNRLMNTTDTIRIVNGKFSYSGDFPHPTPLSIFLIHDDHFFNAKIFVENVKMSMKCKLIKLGATELPYEISGSKFNDQAKDYEKKMLDIMLKAEKEGGKIDFQYLNFGFLKDYIKENPESEYPAYVLYSMSQGGTSLKVLNEYAELMPPNAKNHYFYSLAKKKITELKNTSMGLKEFLKGVEEHQYQADESYDGSQYTNVKYIASFKNDDICMLSANFEASFYERYLKKERKAEIITADPSGKLLTKFEFKIDLVPSVIAVDTSDRIYVLTSRCEITKKKMRGKLFDQATMKEMICKVFDREGKLLREFKLPELTQATGARILGDKLYISDSRKKAVYTYDIPTGNIMSKFDDARPCCGILDIDVDRQGNVLLANLGAFKVEVYDPNGKKTVTFGGRGVGINDFHGCCNPVSLKKLNNGILVTVEKSPTRIKVYSENGASTIKGVKELVKGCSYIPVTSDSKDNVYLASPEKGIVKCVAKKIASY